jgi:hypothetical protein
MPTISRGARSSSCVRRRSLDSGGSRHPSSSAAQAARPLRVQPPSPLLTHRVDSAPTKQRTRANRSWIGPARGSRGDLSPMRFRSSTGLRPRASPRESGLRRKCPAEWTRRISRNQPERRSLEKPLERAHATSLKSGMRKQYAAPCRCPSASLPPDQSRGMHDQ